MPTELGGRITRQQMDDLEAGKTVVLTTTQLHHLQRFLPHGVELRTRLNDPDPEHKTFRVHAIGMPPVPNKNLEDSK